MADRWLTLQISRPELKGDGLWHNKVRYVDQYGAQVGVVVKFSCDRPECLPSTVHDVVTQIQYMIYMAGSELLRTGPEPWPVTVAVVLYGLMEGEIADMPEWFTGSPVWTEFSDDPDAGTVTVPIP